MACSVCPLVEEANELQTRRDANNLKIQCLVSAVLRCEINTATPGFMEVREQLLTESLKLYREEDALADRMVNCAKLRIVNYVHDLIDRLS